MKISVSRKFLLGLCAYLKQMELSIDRSLGNLTDFKTYCEVGPTERLPNVIGRLRILVPQGDGIFNINKPHLHSPLSMRLWSWYLKREIPVDGVLLAEIRVLLESIAVRLNASAELNRNEFVDFRLTLNRLINSLSRGIFPASRRTAVYNVEHLNQNPILKTNSIKTITGSGNWLFP